MTEKIKVAKINFNKSSEENYLAVVNPHLDRIKTWRAEGLGVSHVAKRLGISVPTIYSYAKLFPELQNALDEGKSKLLDNLEQTLFQKAMFGVESVTHETKTNSLTGEVITTERINKGVPDSTLLIFALKTNFPEKYAELVNINLEANDNKVESFADILKGKTDETGGDR